MGQELNQPIFAVQMWTTGRSRGPIAHTTCEIPSVFHIHVGCPATSPMDRRSRPFGGMSFPPLLSEFRCHCHDLSYRMLGHRLPITSNWLEQTAFLQLVREQSRLRFLTTSSQLDLTQWKHWPPLWHYMVRLKICRVPNWRVWRALCAFCLADTTSRWYPWSQIYY